MAYQTIPIKPSTNILSVQWDPETKDLLVTFIRQGRQGIYHGVDGNTAAGFERTSSAGRYLIDFIKPAFPYEEV